MPGNGFWHIWIHQSVLSCHIRWIGGHHIHGALSKQFRCRLDISLHNTHFFLQIIQTDAALRRALKRYTDNATVLIVAQRVGTIRNADQIIVLDEGKIVGKGTHEELLKNCPVYYEIASSQMTKEELE